jgi:hypothetical protein
VYGASSEDVLLLKSLLEATRKLQRQFESRNVECHAIIFVRNDIYQHLVLDPADRGKDTPVLLDWNDPDVFKEILRRRLVASTGIDLPFSNIWSLLFDSHIQGEDSFYYLLNRTLMRPRELLRFARECVDTAVSRGHEKVLEDDVLHAEKSFSEDALVDIGLELKDVNPEYADVTYSFIGCRTIFSRAELEKRITETGVAPEDVEKVIDLLLWFSFIGIYVNSDDERYSYSYQHDVRKMESGLTRYSYCVHPAFRSALECHY